MLCDGDREQGRSARMGFGKPVLPEDHRRQRPQRRHVTLLDLPQMILRLTLLPADVAQHAGLRVYDQPDHAHQHEQRALVER